MAIAAEWGRSVLAHTEKNSAIDRFSVRSFVLAITSTCLSKGANMPTNDSTPIEEMMAQARIAELSERNDEALALLKRVIAEADEVEDRMFAAGTALLLVVNKFLGGNLPKIGTPEYDECYKYLRVAVENYDLSHPAAQAAFSKSTDVNYLRKLLAEMEQEIRRAGDRGNTAGRPLPLYIYRNNQRYGPYEESVVKEWVWTGRCHPNDLAWRDGMNGWQPLSVLFPPAANVQRPPSPASADAGDYISNL
jgi:hypothetical protein